MSAIEIVSASPQSPERFADVLTPADYETFQNSLAHARELLQDRMVWHINSTAAGGGVAEMLRAFIAYAHGGDIPMKWAVVSGNEEFFTITKRIHNLLHGVSGDGGGLGRRERKVYDSVMKRNLEDLLPMISPRDIVCLHDPQTAGMLTRLRETGAVVTWRSHVGTEEPNEHVDAAWKFLTPYLEGSETCIFTRPTYVPRQWGDKHRIVIIPPSIDAFSAKNQLVSEESARAILNYVGLPVGVTTEDENARSFQRSDGSIGLVQRRCEIIGEPFAHDLDVPLVLQTSRWDFLKDHLGVMIGFTEHALADTDAHLILAGPGAASVADDPEGIEVLGRVRTAWENLPLAARQRVHLVCTPTEDLEETAVIVNALQQHSTIVVQKSLQEGFGLTVAEAMWKARPMIASAVGGIQDQIVDGHDGVLLPNPYDLKACGVAIRELLLHPEHTAAMGERAREHVRHDFLDNTQWQRYIALFNELLTQQ